MNKLSSFSIIVVFVLFTLVGLGMLKLLNFQLNPSRSLSSITVSYSWSGNEAKIVEQEITSKLEASFARILGVKDINSCSDNGSGYIWLSLDKEADIDVVRFEISMLVRQLWAGLPQGLSYPAIQADMPDDARVQPLLSYTLNAPVASQQIMQQANDGVKASLAGISGISKIELYGAEPMEWVIEYNGTSFSSLGITESEVQQALRQYISKEGLGLASMKPLGSSTSAVILPVRIQAQSLSTLLAVAIKKVNGHIVTLGEIAKLHHQEAQPYSLYRINGLNTITINIFAQPNQNQIALGNLVKQKILEISKGLPLGYKLENSYDSNEYVERELGNIGWRFFTALGLLLFFVFLIYRQPQYLFLICATFVVNLSIAAIFYYVFKIEIHLYSLAGITVSLGLMTDNIIVMADHLRNRGNRTVWMALLAGTMAMASTLVIIFFLDEKIKANLTDFALIVIINQSVSLLTALFFVPSLMQRLKLLKDSTAQRPKSRLTVSLRFKVALAKGQRFFYRFAFRWRWAFILALILGFGLPLFMLPAKWEGEKWYNTLYNQSFGSEVYTGSIKPIADKVFGGTLRLFVNNVYSGSYFKNNEETSLMISASLPHGSTIAHANALAQGMEKYLTQFKQVRTFKTSVSARQISITIFFKNEFVNGGFPFQLKGLAISKALDLGGAYWNVFGFGDGFSNESRESAGNNVIRMLGYNYETLMTLSKALKLRLMENPRVKEVYLQSELSYFKPDNTEFIIKMDYQKAALAGLAPYALFSGLKEKTLNTQPFATIYSMGKYENLVLRDARAKDNDVWNLKRTAIERDSIPFQFGKFCTIEKELSTQTVCKENQQYSLFLQFEYIGSEKFASKYIKKSVADCQATLPMGYTVKDENRQWSWDNMNKNQYWLIVLIMVVIFFIGSVLFESLLFPFAVILMIPISFIGIFLTFFLFDLNFDQGGFAAFILLCGITVSAAMYIINDYSVLLRKHLGKPRNRMHLYLKAFQYKIIPILLTISATFLGFVPFLIGEKQPFWFSMAAGVCGGLLFTLLGIVIFLPLFLGIKGHLIRENKFENLNRKI